MGLGDRVSCCRGFDRVGTDGICFKLLGGIGGAFRSRHSSLTASDFGGTGGGVREASQLVIPPRGQEAGYDRAPVVLQPLLMLRIPSLKEGLGI